MKVAAALEGVIMMIAFIGLGVLLEGKPVKIPPKQEEEIKSFAFNDHSELETVLASQLLIV